MLSRRREADHCYRAALGGVTQSIAKRIRGETGLDIRRNLSSRLYVPDLCRHAEYLF